MLGALTMLTPWFGVRGWSGVSAPDRSRRTLRVGDQDIRCVSTSCKDRTLTLILARANQATNNRLMTTNIVTMTTARTPNTPHRTTVNITMSENIAPMSADI
jgi:hypothetical protein